LATRLMAPDRCWGTHMVHETEVGELLAAAEGFAVPLRMAQGIDELALERLRTALHRCAAAWEGRDSVPRAAVNVIVDLFPAVEASSELYPEDYRARVLDAAIEISDLVRECVALDFSVES
jgi:hypothetical protein